MKLKWVLAALAFVLLVAYLVTGGRRESFENPTCPSGSTLQGSGKCKSTSGQFSDSTCSNGGTPVATFNNGIVCVPTGADSFVVSSADESAAVANPGPDINMAACKKAGYLLGVRVSEAASRPPHSCFAVTVSPAAPGTGASPGLPPVPTGGTSGSPLPPPPGSTCATGQLRVFVMGGSTPGPKCIAANAPSFDPTPADFDVFWKLGPAGAVQADSIICKKPGYIAGMLMGLPTMPSPKCYSTSSAAAPTPGNTTGGSSTRSLEPEQGGGGDRRKQIFGPLFTSIGDGGNVDGGDSSKTNKYPELLGGGMMAPVKGRQLTKDGSLPSTAGLGSDEDSKYLPTSRVPGDMEKIADPWRVSQSFSAANYSFKTDPVPFLTNFSAFQK